MGEIVEHDGKMRALKRWRIHMYISHEATFNKVFKHGILKPIQIKKKFGSDVLTTIFLKDFFGDSGDRKY